MREQADVGSKHIFTNLCFVDNIASNKFAIPDPNPQKPPCMNPLTPHPTLCPIPPHPKKP